MHGLELCKGCLRPTASKQGICWWCVSGVARPKKPKVEQVYFGKGSPKQARSTHRKAETEDMDPLREARIRAHIERIWGPQEIPMATLSLINNFELTNSQGMTVSGKQGTFSDGFSAAYQPTTSGLIHYVATTLATATVVTVYDDDNDVPADFDYLFFVSDQICYIQLIGSATNVIIKCAALHPFVLSGYDSILAAADTTIITGGSEPSVTDIDSVVIGNYSGSTMNYVFAVID